MFSLACLWELDQLKPFHNQVGLQLDLGGLLFPGWDGQPAYRRSTLVQYSHFWRKGKLIRVKRRPRFVDEDAAVGFTFSQRFADEILREDAIGVFASREPRIHVRVFLLECTLFLVAFCHQEVRLPRMSVILHLSDSFWAAESHLALVHGVKGVAREVLLRDERVLGKGRLGGAERRQLVREPVSRVGRLHESSVDLLHLHCRLILLLCRLGLRSVLRELFAAGRGDFFVKVATLLCRE